MGRVTEPWREVEAPRHYSSRKLWWTLGLKGNGGPGEIWSQAEGSLPDRRCGCGRMWPLPEPGTKSWKEQGRTAPLPALQRPLVSSVGHILTEIRWKGPHATSLEHRETGRVKNVSEGTRGKWPAHSLKERFVLWKERAHQGQLWQCVVTVPQGSSSMHGFRKVSFSRD